MAQRIPHAVATAESSDSYDDVNDSDIFDFFDHHVTEAPVASPEDEHLDNVRRVGRALAMIEHSRLWERAGFASIVAYVESLGVDATVVAMVRRLFRSPTTLARSTSEFRAAQSGESS